jgi:hypothetical protein
LGINLSIKTFGEKRVKMAGKYGIFLKKKKNTKRGYPTFSSHILREKNVRQKSEFDVRTFFSHKATVQYAEGMYKQK